jgi:N-acetylglutamate synthase-like GNAT family acetyltransferase
LVQALLEPGHWGEGVLEGCGFRRIAEIVQMARGVDGECERAAGSDDLEFVSYSPALERQFVRVVEQTYTDSLDCPELDGLRPVEEVLQGYRAAGEFRSAHWWLVREGSEFVGCVLLGHFPESRSAVLQYMGVIPSRRRRGIGLRLVLQALQVASESRAERLTLAVDTRNIHAAQIYNKWGFAQTDRKSVFIVRV